VLLTRTRWGALVRAATQDREMVGALGVDQAKLFTSVFFVGAVLAGLGGALQIPREPANLELDLAIIAESEIWPMTILELGARRVPQVLVNGRLSDRSFARWSKRAHLAEALFENLAHVVAQSDTDGERFLALGARPVTVSGNLKVDTVPPPADLAAVQALKAAIGMRPTWAAVSTHEGEEEIAANVHLALKKRHRAIATVLVPRHPERADAVAEMCAAKGLKVARRSKNEAIGPDTDIYLGDTIGEMGLYLRLTEIAFVGRSLTGEGGQNPLEPAMPDTAVLSGRHVQNFRDAYQTLIQAGGAKLVRDEAMLAGAVNCADDLFIHVGFSALGAMSPSGRSRPFHAEADGLPGVVQELRAHELVDAEAGQGEDLLLHEDALGARLLLDAVPHPLARQLLGRHAVGIEGQQLPDRGVARRDDLGVGVSPQHGLRRHHDAEP